MSCMAVSACIGSGDGEVVIHRVGKVGKVREKKAEVLEA